VVTSFTADDVDALATGARLLGSGGGGDIAVAALLLRQRIGRVQVVAAGDLDPDGLVVHVATIGAPAIVEERLFATEELVQAVRAMEAHFGLRACAIAVLEIGGSNALMPFAVAEELALPVVDSDLMARAYPRLDQTSLAAAGFNAAPVVIVGTGGSTAVISHCSASELEVLVRATCAAMGGHAMIAAYPVVAADLAQWGIAGSVSACVDLGRRFIAARLEPLSVLADRVGFTRLFETRIDDIQPCSPGVPGSMTVEAMSVLEPIRVDFADEFIAITVGGELTAASPDVILALDHISRLPLAPEQLRVGQNVTFATIDSFFPWSHESIDRVGPKSYGLLVDDGNAA
jgi:DUF917 family protein